MGVSEDDETAIVPVLCDPCSARMIAKENWLGVGKIDGFDCMICHRLCCSHLREPGGLAVCVDCI